ncbi:MAG TPA: sulfotransferase [Gammaproteobacteria bacterium]|nr:sulfotransferase [Gammaproteobacteria bacterium]
MARSLIQQLNGKLQRSFLLGSKYCVQRLQVQPSARLTAFVAGVQRSGTNMMMDVLERSYSTEVFHERDQRAFDNYLMRPVPEIRQLHAQSRASVFVIKALCELQRLSGLMDEFRPARTVWVVRNYDDVVNSMLVSFRNHAKQIQRMARDRSSDGWRGEGMSDATHALVRRLTHAELSDASAAALMWYLRNVLFFEQDLDTSADVIVVPYERLVTAPAVEFRRVFAFLGLDYTPRVNANVFPSSIRRRPPPAIDPAIREVCDALTARFDGLAGPRGG